MFFKHVFFVALLLSVALAPALPQTVTGSISGSVRDASGSAVTGAQLKLVSVATGAERTGVPNEMGDFVFGALNPGEYDIFVEATGFKTLERRHIMLTASERLSVGALELAVGAVQEKVTVTAEGTAVQTVSAERSAALSSSQLSELLVRGRNVSSLMSLLPGVVDTADGTAETPSANNASAFNVLGNRNNANNLSVDGLNITQPGGAPHSAFGISVDAIAEVKVLVSNYQAEYGRMSGADIQIVTKAGTRDFHGGASYFKRHEQFNAMNFFSNRNNLAKPRYRYNTWAYNIGGPIYLPGKFNTGRDKLFFFWSHEYWPQRSTSAINYSTMPTELERTGDFSKSVDVNGALVPVLDPLSRVPFAGNVVPASRVDKNGLALLNVFPKPNFFDTSISRRQYNYITQWEVHNPFQLYTMKVDYNVNSKNIISATYTGSPEKSDGPNAGGITAPFATFPGTQSNGWGHLVGVRYQRIFSPTMVNELTSGYVVRYTTVTEPPEALKGFQRATYGFTAGQFNSANNPLDLVPGMSFGGIVGAAGISYDGRFPYDNGRYMFDIGDNLTKTLGAHTLKAGFMFERIKQVDGPWANHFTGTFDFGRNTNNPIDSNYAYANAALGV
ncbi:MAG: Plug and carboxypeptidase regulatory-like domain-containing protein, partial [Acidobacteria bacterium]|nr:Plug and carboxypeptidase regulatory-like domain-containing protein [Acidobacteriota bacterium]